MARGYIISPARRIARLWPQQPIMVFLRILLLTVCVCSARSLPMPNSIEEIVKVTEEAPGLFPEWQRDAGWLGFRQAVRRPDSPLPAEFASDGNLVYSPIRGVVEDEHARLRLGITLREVEERLENFLTLRNDHVPSLQLPHTAPQRPAERQYDPQPKSLTRPATPARGASPYQIPNRASTRRGSGKPRRTRPSRQARD
ncbi:hypothetical protein L1887_51397 [Cichorium endivia]|nr:hypothetical protein L1887_51397 [Cichorium endivia]